MNVTTGLEREREGERKRETDRETERERETKRELPVLVAALMSAGVMPAMLTEELKEITGAACTVGAGLGLADFVGVRVTGASAGDRVGVGAAVGGGSK